MKVHLDLGEEVSHLSLRFVELQAQQEGERLLVSQRVTERCTDEVVPNLWLMEHRAGVVGACW